MKIVKLTAENVKRLRAVSITPDGNVVVVSGRNGQGKSSVLDSIWYALGGKDAQKGVTQPVREGEERASVELDLGDIVVTRTWRAEGSSTLKVTAADGAKYSSPQSVLDKLVGDLSFDPLTFANLPAKDQRQRLLELVGVDLDALDAERRGYFDARTVVNRRVKELETRAGAITFPDGTPHQEESAANVIKSIRNAQEWQRHATDAQRKLDRAAQRVTDAERELAAARDDYQTCTDAVLALPESIPDPAVYEEHLEVLEATNRDVRQRLEFEKIEEQRKSAVKQAAQLTESIKAVDDRKVAALKAAPMPVEHLGFSDDTVTFNDIPLKQASSAEQLRVSVAVAMALNPELRVVRITDGSLLDSTSMAMITRLAEERDYQVWVEVVDESGQVGVVIEDGQVV